MIDLAGEDGIMCESMTQDALLRLLEADARLSDQQIADRLALDVATVAAKRAALEKAGRIVGYQAIVNDDGEGVSAFLKRHGYTSKAAKEEFKQINKGNVCD